MTSPAIPLADLPRLRHARRRTNATRVALAGALVAVVLAATAVASRPEARTLLFLPHGTNGIVVLDLSASISSDTYQRIGETLRELASTHGRFGLVVFSDVAYEALPPGTPAAALEPYARYFTLPSGESAFGARFPANPWTNSFSGGTRIGAGLGLALQLIQERQLRRAGVILVSDLADDPGDLANLASVALAYRNRGIAVKVVALDPQPQDEQLFTHLLSRAATVQQARLPGDQPRSAGAPVPIWLGLLAGVFAVALAANELWSNRLAWDPT